jgi:hypothetical protein
LSNNLEAGRAGSPEIEALKLHLETLKYELDKTRYRTDVLKWIVIALGAVASFAVIDYGKLQLDKFRVTAENQRQLLDAYLRATDAPQPDVWKRKLQVLINFASDEQIKNWAKSELKYVEDFAALDALYNETLKVASQLIDPTQLNAPERGRARIRFDQLYWADLPHAGESGKVSQAMIAFRGQLLVAERSADNKNEWDQLNKSLIQLSKELKESTPSRPH